MHALAIALKQQGYSITGSDDQYFDPAKTALQNAGIEATPGWDADKVNDSLDFVVLGMHAQADNPELAKAQQLGLPVYSFPEFIYRQSMNKQRIVVGGSHGKTTITSMLMHVLKHHNKKFDYVVGADVKGFDSRVRLSNAPIIVIEGDEYLSSRIDPTPKFLRYNHHIGIISGIAWDHINVFSTEEAYIEQFRKFALATPKAGTLVYNSEDPQAAAMQVHEGIDINHLPYKTPAYHMKNGQTMVETPQGEVALSIFGKHNLLNMAAAKEVALRLGINEEEFYRAMASFELPGLRLDVLVSRGDVVVYRDYAHAPSKVKATTEAVKEQHPKQPLTALLELHTYSSLSKAFLPRYADTLAQCDEAIVFIDPQAVAIKKLNQVDNDEVAKAFNHPNIKVVNTKEALANTLQHAQKPNGILLCMSSGNFGGLNLSSLFQ